MILGAEIGLLVYGLYALIRGRFSAGKGGEITGWGARLCGLVCLTPLPFSFVAIAVYGVVLVAQGVAPDQIATDYNWHFLAIEFFVLLAVLLFVYLLAKAFAKAADVDEAAESEFTG